MLARCKGIDNKHPDSQQVKREAKPGSGGARL